MAKTLYGYWSDHSCLVGVAGPNVARVLMIEAEKCTQIDITCRVTINDELPSSNFNRVAEMMLNDVIYSESQKFR